MQETEPRHAVPELELQLTTSGDVSDSKIVEYDLVIGEKGIGEATLALDRQNSDVSIDWLHIKESERGKSYSKQAMELLVGAILKSHSWANRIESATDSVPMMRTNISTPIPEGWHRTFILNQRKEEHEIVDELFRPIGETEDPAAALDCVETGGSVTMAFEKVE